MATYDEAYKTCLEKVKNPLIAKVLVDKYLLCDENRNYVETTPEQMWQRLAKAIAKVEQQTEYYFSKYYELLRDFKFVPGGRILYSLGNHFNNATLKNCFVVDIKDDSIEGIFNAGLQIAETLKRGGGVGIDISPLRPRGSPLKNAAKESSGAVSFMNFYSHITGMIGQNGRIGAMLISIDVSHPDVEEFIELKGSNLNICRYANVSVKLTDVFMQAVVDDLPFNLEWKGKIYKTIKARSLWNKIIHYAWKRAEPGLLFWDEILKTYPSAQYSEFLPTSTNPCSEISLSHGDSCNLGSINLNKYVLNSFEDNAYFDYMQFDHDVRLAIRFLDNIITLEKSPLEFQQWANDNGRRLGLGIMGLADVFMRMKIKFDDERAVSLTKEIMNQFMISSHDASCDLAIERGPFAAFDVDKHMKSEFIQRLPDEIKQKILKTGIRNIGLNAIAPTGSIAILSQCSASIEPPFHVHYIRQTNLGTSKKSESYEVWHATAKEFSDKYNIQSNKLPKYFMSAHEINSDARIKIQSAVQFTIDQSISQTLNFNKDCTEEQIGDAYIQAWRHKCKGITVYRDGSREGVLHVGKTEQTSTHVDEIVRNAAPKRPDVLDGIVHVIRPNGKTYTVFVGLLNNRVYEVFALDHTVATLSDGMRGKIYKHKDDGENNYCFESGALLVRKLNCYEDQDASLITRLISTALRHGTPLEFLIDQIVKSQTPITSFGKAIAKALSHYIQKEEVKGQFKCPKCDNDSIHFEGLCKTCETCGWSVCG